MYLSVFPFAIRQLLLSYLSRNLLSRSEARVFEIVLSGVVPSLFLER